MEKYEIKTSIPAVIIPLIFPTIRFKLKITIPTNNATEKTNPGLSVWL